MQEVRVSKQLLILLLGLCLCMSLARAQNSFSFGSSSNHLIGAELEFSLSPDLSGFLGVGGFAFPIPTFGSGPSVLLMGIATAGVRYWSETPGAGPFAEAGAGLALANFGNNGTRFGLISAGYRWTSEGIQFDLGLSTFVFFENPPRLGLLPRFSVHWVGP